ncbi:hypothetical protein LTR95_008955 [Oleoguttula sp. CCFEE 5521]
MAPAEATIGEKLAILPKVFAALGAALTQLALYPIYGDSKDTGAFRWALYGTFRSLLASLTPVQEAVAFPKTVTVYRSIAKAQKFDPVVEKTPGGVEVCWLGSKKADELVLYFHGGGYAISASDGHIKWLSSLQKDLSAGGRSVAIAVPAYTLSATAPYPQQLKEAVEVTNWLLTDQGRKPSDITLAGDSAGGNLTLALISHILHPHPQIPTKISLSTPFAGTVLISPWCKFAGDASFARNFSTDYIANATGDRWGKQFLGGAPHDFYNYPFSADVKWWHGIEKVSAGVLVNGGLNEVLIDSIEAIAKTLKEAWAGTETLMLPGAHEGMIMDVTLGYTGKAEATRGIESWILKQWST